MLARFLCSGGCSLPVLLIIGRFLSVFLVLNEFIAVKSEGIVEVVDTKHPIVIYGGGDGRNGYGKDSYFGYSIAFMKGDPGVKPSIRFEGEQSSTHGTLFIGAPNEKQVAKNSGIVWACKFSREAQVSCSVLKTISETPPSSSDRSPSCENHLKGIYFPENETEQWIGSSLSASRNQLFACAPRWKLNGYTYRNRYSNYRNPECVNETAMVGACYFANFQNNGISVSHQAPLNNAGNYHYVTTNGKEQQLEYWYLYAQFGMSSHVTLSEDFLVGAPSVRKWSGSFIQYEQQQNTRVVNIYNDQMQISEVESHSLLGYSITSGRFRGSNSYFMAVGAPRADNLRGMVILTKPWNSKSTEVLRWDQFGSYFGYSVATADVNGDGFDELLVGAPYYNPDYKSKTIYNTGCVLIYDVNPQNLKHKLCTESNRGIIQVTKGARFGSAIVNLGDLNADGKEDFAIGAPYDDDGVGTVFIYYGGKNEPAQIIKGKSLQLGDLQGFGSQLLCSGTNTVDIDGNDTPDLAIGAFESRHVLILRTRPTAKATLKITFHDPTSTNEKGTISKFLPTQEKLRVRTCVYFHFSVKLPKDNQLETWIRFVVDPNEKRFAFDDRMDTEQTHLLSTTKESCVDRRLRTIKDLAVESNQNRFLFKATLWYNETKVLESDPVQHAKLVISPEPRQSSRNEFKQEQSYERAHRSFNPFLPAPIPETEAEKDLLIVKDTCDLDGDPQCNPKLELELEPPIFIDLKGNRYSPGEVPRVGDLKTLLFTVILTNKGETAYEPILQISLGISNHFEVNRDLMSLEWPLLPSKGRGCVPGPVLEDGTFTIVQRRRCSQPLQNGKKYEYNLKVDNLNNAIKIRDKLDGELNLKIEAFPELQIHEKDEKRFKQNLKGKVELEVKDEVLEQSDIDPKNGVDISQLYILKNKGNAPISTDGVKAEIWIPAFVSHNNNKTQALGVLNPSTNNMRCETNGEFYDPSSYLNQREKVDLNSTKTSEGRVRTTRSVNTTPLLITYPTELTLTITDSLLTLSGCDKDIEWASILCQKITCFTDLPVGEIREIRLTMIVFHEVLDEILMEETTGIRVQSQILVSYPGDQMKLSGTVDRKFIQHIGIPAYFYLGAVGIGAVFLIILAYILYRCGFFRRKAKEQLQQLKRQTMALDMTNLNLDLEDSVDENEVTNVPRN